MPESENTGKDRVDFWASKGAINLQRQLQQQQLSKTACANPSSLHTDSVTSFQLQNNDNKHKDNKNKDIRNQWERTQRQQRQWQGRHQKQHMTTQPDCTFAAWHHCSGKFAMKIALGEMSMLLFESQRVSASKITDAGFDFEFQNIRAAINAIYKTSDV